MSQTSQEWQKISLSIVQNMAEIVKPTVSPLSVSEDLVNGLALGTATYLAFRGFPYLITADHVVAEAANRTIGHLPIPGHNYVALTSAFHRSAWPRDVAFSRLLIWPETSARQALSMDCLDTCYNPIEDELLFLLGFPGSTASRHEPVTELKIGRTLFGVLPSSGWPILTQSPKDWQNAIADFDPAYHFLIFYPTTGIRNAGGPEIEFRNPEGLSGSLIWDTKWVAAARAGVVWTPNMAKVCGLTWGAPKNSNLLIATKVEHLRTDFLQFVREEAAYFCWLSNGCKRGKALDDWVLAEKAIPAL